MKVKKMKRAVVLVLIALFVITNASVLAYADDKGQWNTKADMLVGKAYLGVQTIGDKIYTFGGYTNYEWPFTLHEYSPSSNTWRQIYGYAAYMGGNSASAVWNNKLYVFANGYEWAKETLVQTYDPATDKWNWISCAYGELPYAPATAVADGKIYILGGGNGNTYDCSNAVKVFDAQQGKWSDGMQPQGISMPTARALHGAAAVNGKIYVMGGRSAGVLNSTVDQYDPATNTWTTKASMPTPRDSFAAVTVGNKIYVVGGKNDQGILSSVDVYDTITDTWSTLNEGLSSGRFGLGATVLNGIIYAAGGMGNDYWECLKKLETCDLNPDVPANVAAETKSDSITVSWSPANQAAGYDVEVDGTVIDNGKATQYVLGNLQSGSAHVFKVRSKNSVGTSAWSTVLNVSTTAAQNEEDDITLQAITISWGSVNQAESYDVEVDSEVIDNGKNMQYSCNNLLPGTNHVFRVRCRNSAGIGKWSAPTNVSVPAQIPQDTTESGIETP